LCCHPETRSGHKGRQRGRALAALNRKDENDKESFIIWYPLEIRYRRWAYHIGLILVTKGITPAFSKIPCHP
jgi:hypothetical protein